MNKNLRIFLIVSGAVVILALLLALALVPGWEAPWTRNPPEASELGYGQDAVKAVILKVAEEGTIKLGDVQQTYQIFQVRILEGEYQGVELTVDYGRRQIRPPGLNLEPGDRVILGISKGPENILQARFPPLGASKTSPGRSTFRAADTHLL